MAIKERILIYSSELGGHRQLFCDVLSTIFIKEHFEVVILAGINQESEKYWYHLEKFKNRSDIRIFDTYKFPKSNNGMMSVDEIVKFQEENDISYTLFICGDEMITQFLAIADNSAPRFKGKNIAIFGNTEYWYPKESILQPGLNWHTRWLELRGQITFGRYYEKFFSKILHSPPVLDSILVKDERVANDKGTPFFWYPDIYRVFDNQEEDSKVKKEFDEVIPALSKFLADHNDLEPILYFGIPDMRKGYDLILNLALQDSKSCFIHCGDPYNGNQKFEIDVFPMHNQLVKEDRIFETGNRLENWRAIDVFWKSINRFVLGNRIYISSGTMLQALNAGKPVLCPNRGLVGYRTNNNNLGMTYSPRNFIGLKKSWDVFKSLPVTMYDSSIKKFMEPFTFDTLSNCILNSLN